MLLLLNVYFESLTALNMLIPNFCIVFTYLYPFLFKFSFCMICFRLNNFTFIFIFSIAHSGFTPKIIPHTLDNVFITRPHIFLLEIHLKLVMEFLVLRFLIGWWLVGRWLVYLVAGWLVGCWWKVGGWSVVLRKPIN